MICEIQLSAKSPKLRLAPCQILCGLSAGQPALYLTVSSPLQAAMTSRVIIGPLDNLATAVATTAASGCMPPTHQPEWSQLPKEVLSAILQHVSLQHRFSACALVSKAWQAAAAAVPVTTLSTQRPSAAALKSVWEAQARSFGPQLTCLSLQMKDKLMSGAYDYPILQLPCPGLRGLDLESLAVNLAQDTAGPAEGSAAFSSLPLSTVASLTKLHMQHVVLLGQRQQRLAAWAALTGLQHLHAKEAQHAIVVTEAGRGFPGENEPLLPDGLLSHLQQLTYLHIEGPAWSPTVGTYYLGPAVSPAGLQDVTRLTGLQHLGLSLSAHYDDVVAAPEGIAGLKGLTHVMLRSVDGSSLPNLAPLAALQHLHLAWCGPLQAAALTGLTGLHHVHLEMFSFHGEDDVVAFLSWPQQQRHMTYLFLETSLILEDFEDIADLPEDAQALYAAVTGLPAQPVAAANASGSKLQQLTLNHILPPSAWQHVFPAGQQCLALTSLEIGSNQGPASNAPWQCLAAACPNLQKLSLCAEYEELENMCPISELQPLTALTSLTTCGLSEDQMPHLLQLTRLQDLALYDTSISEACVGQLTKMQQLTKLKVERNDRDDYEWSKV